VQDTIEKKKCTKCSAYKNEYGLNCHPFSGNPNAEFYFLGEMAGRNEAIYKRHFIGKAGKILDKLLEIAGLSRQEIAIANALRCWKKGNTKPTKRELDLCFEHTLRELDQINPKLVIALGTTALYQLTDLEGIEIYRGKLLFSRKINRKVFATYHPMAIGYDQSKKGKVEEDFKKIKSLLDKEPQETKNFRYKIIDNINDFDKIFDLLIGRNIYFDLETTGLDPFEDKINIIQLSDGKEPIYILPNTILMSIRDKLKKLFENSNIIGQDFSFDMKFLYSNLGILPRKWEFDTCLAEYILTGMKDNNLNYLVSKYVPEYLGYWEEVKQAGGAHKVTDKEVLYQYGANDVGVLYPIRKKQFKRIISEKYDWVYENLMMPTNYILTKMALHGVKYDIDEVKRVDKIYKQKAEKAWKKVQSLDGVKATEKKFGREFNPRSPLMLKYLLLDYYELPILKYTKKNNPSISKDEMKIYARKYKNPYCRAMTNYRSLQGVRANFLSGVLPKLIDGIAHTKYSLHNTATGRPTSENPNLQNIPREKDIKRCIIARDGNKFICADYSQLEVRISSVVYNEPRLIEICNDFSKDIHCRITAQAFNRDYDEIYTGYDNGDPKITELRVRGKAVQFGVIYQEGPYSLAYDLGISVKKAKEFIDSYYENFPDLKKNIQLTIKKVINDGYLKNYFGFCRRWKDHGVKDYNTHREAVNFLVQSLAWNILQLALIQINKELESKKVKSRLVMQVYDSIVIESPDEEIDEMIPIMKQIMEDVNKPFDRLNKVKLKVDIEVGNNLADLKKIENIC